MNVTNGRFKNRQLHIEDYRQMVSAKQREYAEVFTYQKIAENNDTITDFWTDNLMELILRKDNLNKAYKKVKSNKGTGGIDGMQVDKLLPYLRVHITKVNGRFYAIKQPHSVAQRSCLNQQNTYAAKGSLHE